jgi:hypothetical protein
MFKNVLSNKKLNFFSTSLGKNIPLIKENYINLKKFYKNFNLYIVCPSKDLAQFQSELNFSNIQIINEDLFLSKSNFSKIFNKYFSKSNYFKKIKWREGWYYQQILKISFVFLFFKKKNTKHLIQWEADTIILKKIVFFNKNKPIYYGTLFEKNESYFITLKELFGKLPKYYLSFTFQFSALNFYAVNSLFLKLVNYRCIEKKESTPQWLSKAILQSIIKMHSNYHISLFSEQDFYGIGQLLNQKKNYQKPFIYFRNFTKGELSNWEIKILKILNFYHITYDNYDLVKNKKSSLITFFYYVLKLIFSFQYRKFKYLFNNFLGKN